MRDKRKESGRRTADRLPFASLLLLLILPLFPFFALAIDKEPHNENKHANRAGDIRNPSMPTTYIDDDEQERIAHKQQIAAGTFHLFITPPIQMGLPTGIFLRLPSDYTISPYRLAAASRACDRQRTARRESGRQLPSEFPQTKDALPKDR